MVVKSGLGPDPNIVGAMNWRTSTVPTPFARLEIVTYLAHMEEFLMVLAAAAQGVGKASVVRKVS